MKKIKVDKVILYYMDRVDPDGNLYRFYVYKDMASEIEYFCTEETGNMTIPIGTKERYTKMVSNNTSDWKTQIDKLIDDEVKSIGMWMWGDVKGYVLEKKVKFVKKYKDESREDEEGEEWEEVDSCWDYYMETDELIEEIMKEHNLKE